MIVELCGFDLTEEQAWDEYVYQHPQTGHSHLSGWHRVVEESYGQQSFYLWARENNKIRGILPLVVVRGMFFGRSLVSLPFLDEGGICADDDQIAHKLLEAAVRLTDDHRVDVLDLRHRFSNGLGLPIHGSKMTLVLQLASDPEQMWERFDAKLRNQIRKAKKSGLTTSWNDIDALDDFYQVFSINMRDLGTPVHSRQFFAAILREFSNGAKLIRIHKDGGVIGAGLCLSFKDTLLMPWASSRREYFSLCPNNLLYWEVIRRGCEEGYRRFDFGRSTPGTGPYHFKKQWGGVEKSLPWQYLGRNGYQTTLLRHDDPKYQWGVQTWQRLPLALTNLIGPSLRKRMSN